MNADCRTNEETWKNQDKLFAESLNNSSRDCLKGLRQNESFASLFSISFSRSHNRRAKKKLKAWLPSFEKTGFNRKSSRASDLMPSRSTHSHLFSISRLAPRCVRLKIYANFTWEAEKITSFRLDKWKKSSIVKPSPARGTSSISNLARMNIHEAFSASLHLHPLNLMTPQWARKAWRLLNLNMNESSWKTFSTIYLVAATVCTANVSGLSKLIVNTFLTCSRKLQ